MVDIDPLPRAEGRCLNLRLIFVAAKDDADGRIVLRGHHLLLKMAQVEIHLPCVPIVERPDLEIHQYGFLPGFKTKAGAQFQEERL